MKLVAILLVLGVVIDFTLFYGAGYLAFRQGAVMFGAFMLCLGVTLVGLQCHLMNRPVHVRISRRR